MNIDKLPPHSIEAEQGVLSCMLQESEVIDACVEKIKPGADVFYDLRHRDLYEVLTGLRSNRVPVDLITTSQKLRDTGKLDAIGGLSYLSAVRDAAPSHYHLDHYIEIILSKFVLRKLIQSCANSITKIYDNEGDNPASLIDAIERDIHLVRDCASPSSETLEWKEHVRGAITQIEEWHQAQGRSSGVTTGFIDLDKMTRGFQPGDMIVIAGRPGTGKTSLAMNIVERVAVDNKQSVGVFSLEMTAQSLAVRMLCSRAEVNARDLEDGVLVRRDAPKIMAAAGKLARAQLEVQDPTGLTILELKARARRMARRKKIKLLVIDYLQLIHGIARGKNVNREREVAEISLGIKELAKELSIPVIILAQLNRELEKDNSSNVPGKKRKFRKPRLSDLRESGAIEQDADIVGMLYKPNADEAELAGEGDVVAVNLLIAKQRNGPTGDVHLTFFKNYTRFISAT